ncbi:hypothetical protein B566_EDAN017224 [Ephemera danica]|nr:hypothetical protein B566_EDAN017224 [Ephemera danica]
MGSSTAHVMTLANSIIGVSVLAMPYCFKQCGIILSILMLVLSSIITRLCCHFLVKSATIARRRTYEFLAFHTFGPTGKLAVELSIIGFLLGTCIAFFVVMGDLGPDILTKSFGFKHSEHLRTSVLIGLAVLVVLPLGLLRNVDSLSAVCTASILFYLCLVLKVVSEATPHLLAADWLDYVNLWRPAGILQCIPIFSMALACQTQVFEIYEALPEASPARMNDVVRAAVNICTGVYICVGFFGYVAFCTQNFSGNVLMSFSPSAATDVMKLGFVLSVAVSFPLVIFPCRASLYSLLFRRVSSWHPELVGGPVHIPEGRFKCLTVFLVGVSLIVGLMLPNIELVLGLVGSTIGTIICLLLPALVFTRLASKYSNKAAAGEYDAPISLRPPELHKPPILDINKLHDPEVVLGKGVIGSADAGKKLKEALADIIVEHDKKKKKKVEAVQQPPIIVEEKPKKQEDDVKKKEEPLLKVDTNAVEAEKKVIEEPPKIIKQPEIPPKVEVPRIVVPKIEVPAPIVPQQEAVAPEAIRKDEEERAAEEEKKPVVERAAEPAAQAVPAAGNSGEQKLLAKLAEHEETQQKLLQEQKQILQELKQQQQEQVEEKKIPPLKEDAVKKIEPALVVQAANKMDKLEQIPVESAIRQEAADPIPAQPVVLNPAVADKAPGVPVDVPAVPAKQPEVPVSEQKLKDIVFDLQKLTIELESLNKAPAGNADKVPALKAKPVGELLESKHQKQKLQPQDSKPQVDIQSNLIPENKKSALEPKVVEVIKNDHEREKREVESQLNETCTQANLAEKILDTGDNPVVDEQKLVKDLHHLTPPEVKLSNPDISPAEGMSEEMLLGKPMSRDLRSVDDDDNEKKQ